MGSIPNPTFQQQQRLNLLNGLPFIAMELPPESVHRVVGQLLDGSKIRAEDIERVWNEALIWDCIEGPGAWCNMRATSGGVRDVEILVHAEKFFGVEIYDAVSIYLQMEKSTYGLWDKRPRALWPRPRVN